MLHCLHIANKIEFNFELAFNNSASSVSLVSYFLLYEQSNLCMCMISTFVRGHLLHLRGVKI